MKPQALVIVDDSVCFTWLRDALADRMDLVQVSSDDLAGMRERITAEVSASMLFLQFDGGRQDDRAGLTEWISENRPDLPVIALALGEQPELMLAAMRAGARDFVIPDKNEDLLQAVEKAQRRKASVARASARRGRLFSVIGAQPIDGIPFLGIHLALAIGEQLKRDERVLLVDCSFPAGAAKVFLNVEPTFGLLDAVGQAHRCDQTLIDTAFTQHESGLYLLALPESLVGPPSISASDMAELLDHMLGFFSAVVFAADSALGVDSMAAAVGMSAQSVLLTDQSILKSHQNKRFAEALRHVDAPTESIGLVVDNFKRRLGLDPERLASILEIDLLDTLEGSGVERIQSMNTGSPLFSIAPKDKYCADVRRLAAKLTGLNVVETQEESKGLFNRLLS